MSTPFDGLVFIALMEGFAIVPLDTECDPCGPNIAQWDPTSDSAPPRFPLSVDRVAVATREHGAFVDVVNRDAGRAMFASMQIVLQAPHNDPEVNRATTLLAARHRDYGLSMGSFVVRNHRGRADLRYQFSVDLGNLAIGGLAPLVVECQTGFNVIRRLLG